MRFGLSEARQLFPCLLQCSEVPTWMFLGWINQLFANLNTSIGPILQDLIFRLAQALRNMLFADTLIEKFLQAFSCLGQPYMMLVYFVKTLASMLQDQTPNKKSLSFVYDSMVKELFSKELFSNDIRNKIHGRAFVNISKYQNPLKKLKSQIKEGDKTVVNKLLEIKTNIEAEMESNRQTYRLMKDYSPWLSEFQSGNYSLTELEIPGQYTGDRRPLPQHHVKIVGFKQNVVIMKSIKKPLVIIILGSDAKEHKYLVKFGEDLRQDQRLQQLFGLMNKIMCQDPACRQRDLSLITYQVVPFSSHLGIVERVIQKMSISPESYFSLRQNFASSYAVMCISHWLLGIGDRHLENTLVSLIDGRCVGIDFGYAFGAATQFIGVPELMPFRLTPHIVNLLQPLEEKGLLRETMIHCLRTLRSRSDILLATMEVFVQEPSMDWLMFARINKDSERGEKEEWYPQQKLNLAKMKLNGANPAIITKIELESRSKMDPDTLQSIIAVAVGNPNENIRAQYPDHHLEPDQQVDCLIDQATDYHILSKTFRGWSAWV
ncbi:hypothetical protein C0J52_27083 [Blattella germanica]|nr:hypothetical protein C0J52_27083 [Blattella germanica]